MQGHDSEALQPLLGEAANLVMAGDLPGPMSSRRGDGSGAARDESEQTLRELTKPVETSSMGDENGTHSTITTLICNDINDTVWQPRSVGGLRRVGAKTPLPFQAEPLFPESLTVTPATLVELAPRLAPYMPARFSDMTWPAIVEAALSCPGKWASTYPLGPRVRVMGREYAAVAVAIVSIRPPEHFTSGPGGYFAGMLRKFEKSPTDLCLGRTLWKLKNERWGKDGHKERGKDEHRCRIEATTETIDTFRSSIGAADPCATGIKEFGRRFVQAGGVFQQLATLSAPPAPPRPNLARPAHITRLETIAGIDRNGTADQGHVRQTEEQLSRFGMNPGWFAARARDGRIAAMALPAAAEEFAAGIKPAPRLRSNMGGA